MHDSLVLKFRNPHDNEFGHKTLVGKLFYGISGNKPRKLEWLLGENSFDTKVFYSTSKFGTPDCETEAKLKIGCETHLSPGYGSNPCDNIGFSFSKWPNSFDLNEDTITGLRNCIQACPLATAETYSDNLTIIPTEALSKTDVAQEVREFCTITTSIEFLEFFKFLGELRFGNDSFSSTRKVLKGIYSGPIRSVSAYQDIMDDLWNKFLGLKLEVRIQDISPLTDDEAVSWFLHQVIPNEGLIPLHASHIFETCVETLPVIKDGSYVTFGAIIEDSVIDNKFIADLTSVSKPGFHYPTTYRSIVKINFDLKVFEIAIANITNRRGTDGEHVLNKGCSALEQIKYQIVHTTPSDITGVCLNIPLDQLDITLELFKVALGIENTWSFWPIKDTSNIKLYEDSITSTIDIGFDKNQIKTIRYCLTPDYQPATSVNEAKELDKLTIDAILSLDINNPYNVKLSTTTLNRESRIEELSVKLTTLYEALDPLISHFVAYQLGLKDLQRSHIIDHKIIPPRATVDSQDYVNFLSKNDSDTSSVGISFNKDLFIKFFYMFDPDSPSAHKAVLERVTKSVSKGIPEVSYDRRSFKTDSLKFSSLIFDEAISELNGKSNSLLTEEIQVLFNSHRDIAAAFMWTKINTSIVDGTFLDLRNKNSVIGPQTLIFEWLSEEQGHKNIGLIRSIYA